MASGRDTLIAGGVVGPVAFIAAWNVSALLISGEYSPIDDAISRLAAVGADTRWLMTVGFVVFGVTVIGAGQALRRLIDGPAWITMSLTGLATLAVAATPLDWSSTVDRLHGVAAGTGYVALAATSLFGGWALRERHQWLARFGFAAGTVSAIALALTLGDLPTGLVQRIGLTASDLWIIALAVTMLRPPSHRGRGSM